MLISFCIPTYNRCHYLILALNDLLQQAINLNVENSIEICISDNASTDNTKKKLEELKAKYPQFKIHTKYNETNIGPDLNFIQVLKMGSGDFLILKGDDDFLKPNGLSTLLKLVKENPSIDFFISDVEIVNTNREFIKHVNYLRNSKNEIIVDFTNEIEARNYFALCENILALGSFISGVVIKREAIENIKIDPCFIGTNYSFLFYFWKYLSEGHKLKYNRTAYIQATVGTESTYGKGIARDAIDLNITALIADYFFKDSYLNQDIKNVVNRMYKYYAYIPINQKKDFNTKLYPALFKTNHPLIQEIKSNASLFSFIKYALYSIIPSTIIIKLKKLLKKNRH